MNLLKVMQCGVLGWLPLGQRHCAICNGKIWGFLAYRGGSARLPPLMRALDVIGSDVDNYECPRCGSHDRERHLFMYLSASGLLSTLKGKSVLHFAPEKRLEKKILSANPASYIGCDLYPTRPDIKRVDMLDMDFDAESFDVVIANHVLEHVADDGKALSEISRVLRPGGYAVLQTPYCNKILHTWEDEGIKDEYARLMAYGQEDHVRLYGRDIFDRFGANGFISNVRSHSELLAEKSAKKYGVNASEPFMLFKRDG